jgi:hypothetical protein
MLKLFLNTFKPTPPLFYIYSINKRKSTKTVPLKQGFNPIYDESNNKEPAATSSSIYISPSDDEVIYVCINNYFIISITAFSELLTLLTLSAFSYKKNDKESNDVLSSELKKYSHIKR